MSDDRHSIGEAIRAVPRVTKLVTGAISALTAVGTVSIGAAVWLDGLASDHEVSAQIEPLAKREDVDRSIGALRMEADQVRRTDLRRSIAMFEHLVSLKAADLERDARRKAEAAAFARTAYREALDDVDDVERAGCGRGWPFGVSTGGLLEVSFDRHH